MLGNLRIRSVGSPNQTGATPTPTPSPPTRAHLNSKRNYTAAGWKDRDPHVDSQTGIGHYEPNDVVRLSARVRDESLRDNLLNINQLNPSTLSVTFEFLGSNNSSLGELSAETKVAKNTLLDYDDYELVQRVSAEASTFRTARPPSDVRSGTRRHHSKIPHPFCRTIATEMAEQAMGPSPWRTAPCMPGD